MNRPWTTKEVDQLRQHYGEIKVSEIAIELDRSPDAIGRMAGRLNLKGLPPAPFKARHSNSILEMMIIEGLGKKAIAEALGEEAKRITQMVRRRLTPEMNSRFDESSMLEKSFTAGGPWFEQYTRNKNKG